MSAPADAAVVVVNYRTAELVESCLSAVEEARGSLRLEILVVDNSEADELGALRERRPELMVRREPENRGFGAGVNAGFTATSAPYVLVFNPDALPQRGAIERLVTHLRAHPATAVAAPLLVDDRGEFQPSARHRFPNLATLFVDFCVPAGFLLARAPRLHPQEIAERELAEGPVAHVMGAAFAVRRDAFADAGPFDEKFFMYFEETEWQQRLRRRGWSIDIVPDARVVHLLRGGQDSELFPLKHYLPSAYRYLQMQGHSERSIDTTLRIASWLSRLALAPAISLLPRRRELLEKKLREARAVLAYVRSRRSERES